MVGRASALCPRDCVFDPRPSHRKGLHGNIYYFAWSSALRKKLEIRNGTVLVMIFYFGDTLKVSIELPATFSCRHNMTDITKTYLYNFDPLEPHFYIVKLGFTGVYIIFLIFARKHRLWLLVRTASTRRF